MKNAYMIRNDGTLFPVTVHIYGSVEDIEETLAAAEWLYSHTNESKTKEDIVDLVIAYAKELDPDVEKDEVADTLLYTFKHAGYKVCSESFLNSLPYKNPETVTVSAKTLNLTVVTDLNQEFLRARYGGLYDSSAGNRDMYFRISSVGFNWFDIIWNFVYQNRNAIDTVTITKDEESTGLENYFYKIDGEPALHMPVAEFIEAKGNPVIDSAMTASPVYNKLPRMNPERFCERLKMRHTKDAKENFIYVKNPGL